jgi:hypothetical protein
VRGWGARDPDPLRFKRTGEEPVHGLHFFKEIRLKNCHVIRLKDEKVNANFLL